MTPGPRLPLQSGLGREEKSAWGGRRYCCREWLTCGVRLAAAAGEAEGRAGVSGVLGRLAGPGAAARRLGWLAGRAGCEAFFFSFLFMFYFSSSLFEFKFDLEFEFKSGVPPLLDF